MSKTYLRILSIRRHKTITFLTSYNYESDKMQYMLDNDISKDLNCGDIIYCETVDDVNNRGDKIKRITNIDRRVACVDFPSYKGIDGKITDQSLNNYLNARNCGSQINVLKFKADLLNGIQEALNNLGYFNATGLLNTVENYANGSGIEDAVIQDRDFNQPRYLRVTLENQLKQMTATILQSTYALEKVFRNMGEDASHINEFLMLELVDIHSSMSQILEFVKKLDIMAKTLGDKHGLIVPDKELKIIDFRELDSNRYEELRKGFNNTIVLNFPCESPFILMDEEGIRKETRWYVNGHWIGHYYEDEFDYQKVKEVIDRQNQLSNKDNVNPMTYFEMGLPPSISMGLSIDRWIQMLMDMNHISSIANPIELDHKRRCRQ